VYPHLSEAAKADIRERIRKVATTHGLQVSAPPRKEERKKERKKGERKKERREKKTERKRREKKEKINETHQRLICFLIISFVLPTPPCYFFFVFDPAVVRKLEVLPLEMVYSQQVSRFLGCQAEDLSPEESRSRLTALFAGLRTPSARADLLRILRRKLLVYAARSKGLTKVKLQQKKKKKSEREIEAFFGPMLSFQFCLFAGIDFCSSNIVVSVCDCSKLFVFFLSFFNRFYWVTRHRAWLCGLCVSSPRAARPT
jgi:hypothetical protein